MSDPLVFISKECLFCFGEILKFQPKSKLKMILSQLIFDNLVAKLSKYHTFCG